MQTVGARWPRLSAMLAFGSTGLVMALLWWTPLIFQSAKALPYVLFILLPGVSAGIAGGLFGKPLIEANGGITAGQAMLRGAATGIVALVLFAPLFATAYELTAPARERADLIGLTVFVLAGSLVAVGWMAALAGAAVGWALNRSTVYRR